MFIAKLGQACFFLKSELKGDLLFILIPAQSPGFSIQGPAHPVHISVLNMLLPSCNGQTVKAEPPYSPLGIMLMHTCSTVYTRACAFLPRSSSVAQKWVRRHLSGSISENLQHAAILVAPLITSAWKSRLLQVCLQFHLRSPSIINSLNGFHLKTTSL